MEALGDVDRLVLLGDLLELRHGPVFEALGAAEAFARDVGEAMAGREIVLLAGNHDRALLEPWFERRRREGWPPPLGLEERVEIGADGALATLVAGFKPAEVRVAYPGVWLRDDVYAFHGHYLDVHFTVPTFERLAAGIMRCVEGEVPERGAGPDDYERILAPLYAWLHAVAQAHPPERGVAKGQQTSAKLWRRLTAGSAHAPLRSRVLRLGFGTAIAALNRTGIGPLRSEVSGAELRRAALVAVGGAVARLGIGADHVLFGHSHRSGPWPGDDPAEWRTPTGARLWNTGTWVWEPNFVTHRPNESPYWPGAGVRLGDAGPPEPVRLLADDAAEDLRPARA